MKKQWREFLFKLIYLAVIVGLVAWGLSSHFTAEEYQDDISTRDDSISGLNRRNRGLEIELQVLEQSLLLSEEEIAGYEDDITKLKRKRITDKKKHEKEIADINSIPGDSLYVLVTGRLN